jgi:hypothetical protein
MSIFDKFPNIEECINQDTEDKAFNMLFQILKEFLEEYKSNNYNQNIKQFCTDCKKVFELNSLFWQKGLNEIKEDIKNENKELSSEEAFKLNSMEKMLEDTKFLIMQFPNDDFIEIASDDQLLEYINQNENKIKTLSQTIINFFEDMTNELNELNDTMKNLGDTLEKSTYTLKITIIINQLKNKIDSLEQFFNETQVGKFISEYKWFLATYNEIKEYIEKFPSLSNDQNTISTQEILIKVIDKYSIIFKDIQI